MKYSIQCRVQKILCFFLCIFLVMTTMCIKPAKKVYADDSIGDKSPTNAYTFYNDSDYKTHIGYFSDTGRIYFVAKARTASSGVRFRTLGFQVEVTIHDITYYCRIKLDSKYIKKAKPKIVGDYTYSMWYMNYNMNDSNFMDYMKSHFPSGKDDFDKVATTYTAYLQFDSIITINDEGKLLGSMNDNGDIKDEVYLTEKGIPQFNTDIKKADSDWKFTSKYDDSKGGIHGARTWADPNFSDYFKIQIRIPPDKVPMKRSIKVFYKLYDSTTNKKTNTNIMPSETYKTVTFLDKKDVWVPYKNLSNMKYKFVGSSFRYDGKTFSNYKSYKDYGKQSKKREIVVNKTHESEHVIFFYEPDVHPTKIGTIEFDPDSTDGWTNDGKIDEGKGKYPVKVFYKGDDPVKTYTTVEATHTEKTKGKDGKETTKTSQYQAVVEERWGIKDIRVSGAVTDIINGKSGNVNLEKEGEGQTLHGEGDYSEKPEIKVYLGDDSDTYPDVQEVKPDKPEGDSDDYDLDWTKPNIDITPSADNKWHNDDPYNVHLKVDDELSGVDSDESYVKVTDNSHYKNKIFEDKQDDGDNSDDNSGGDIDTGDNDSSSSGGDINTGDGGYNDDTPMTDTEALEDDFDDDISLDQDGMYSFDVKATDEATNENSEKQETYLVDSTQPDVAFSVRPKIFSEANGAVRKDSKKGTDFAYYGTLTFADNLSGVASVSYAWAYGTSSSAGDYGDGDNNTYNGSYETLYTNDYTTTDRYGELNKDDAGNLTGTEGEVHSAEIEKPVGDNLYLYIKEIDTAGNETDATFGPYEDPIKMRDFEVTDVRDPLWDSVFWKDSSFTQPTRVTYKASQLPIDSNSHPTIKNAAPKLGYSFYFDITTEFLYREQDRIEIQPTFFYWDGKTRVPVDAYYNSDNNELTKLGSSQDMQKLNLNTSRYGNVLIGNLSDLTLTKGVRVCKGREWTNGWKGEIQYSDGKIQWWYGKYFLPATSVFVRQGQEPNSQNFLRDKNIIVNFDIVAYKNGIETLSGDQEFYYSPGQWQAEGGPKSQEYEPGDVIVYDNKHTVLSNYRSYIIQ